MLENFSLKFCKFPINLILSHSTATKATFITLSKLAFSTLRRCVGCVRSLFLHLKGPTRSHLKSFHRAKRMSLLQYPSILCSETASYFENLWLEDCPGLGLWPPPSVCKLNNSWTSSLLQCLSCATKRSQRAHSTLAMGITSARFAKSSLPTFSPLLSTSCLSTR